MDIKTKRRDAVLTGKRVNVSVVDEEGMVKESKKALGISSSDNNVGWDVRASSWQRGADTNSAAIEAECMEQNAKWGTPYKDNFPCPSDGNSDGNAPLPNPHNFSSNPGFMGAMGPSDAGNFAPSSPPSGRSLQGSNQSAGGKQTSGGSTGHLTSVGKNKSAAMPAPADTNPYSEGGPQIVTSGYNG